mgnify:CR=1 FL=1
MEHITTFPLPPVTLVLGGARSGKSTHAEKLATGTLHGGAPRPAVYVATAEAGDVEMATRIMAHRARRGGAWTTFEEPLKLAETLEAAAAAGQPILVDCLTLWLSNLMHAGADLDEAADDLVRALDDCAVPVVMVSNEVGLVDRRADHGLSLDQPRQVGLGLETGRPAVGTAAPSATPRAGSTCAWPRAPTGSS